MTEIANRKSQVTDPIIAARGLHKSFKMGDAVVTVLKDCSFDVKPGEFVAIEGRSGTGKSTLLHILAGLDQADQGELSFDGIDIASLARRAAVAQKKDNLSTRFGSRALISKIAAPFVAVISAAAAVGHLTINSGPDRALARIRNENFGFVFQFYHLLPELNVLENVMIGAMIKHSIGQWASFKHPAQDRAKEVLEQMGLSHRLHHRPGQLSGGERQRVAIARALMNKPKVLYADEPTGNLDVETGQQIMGVLEDLHQNHGQTIVMVTHDRTLAREADRALILRDGKLVAS